MYLKKALKKNKILISIVLKWSLKLVSVVNKDSGPLLPIGIIGTPETRWYHTWSYFPVHTLLQ